MNSSLASAQETPTNTKTGADYVAWTLDQLSAMFGHLFDKDNQIQLSNGKTALGDRSGLWAAELSLVKPEWITFGLNRYRERIRAEFTGGDKCWPPTAVQFAMACIPTAEDLGFADESTAWLTACSNSSQPKAIRCDAIRAAAEGMWFEIRSTSSAQGIRELSKRFKKSYQGVINRVLAGEDITRRKLIENSTSTAAKPQAVADPEAIRAKVKEIKKMLGATA